MSAQHRAVGGAHLRPPGPPRTTDVAKGNLSYRPGGTGDPRRDSTGRYVDHDVGVAVGAAATRPVLTAQAPRAMVPWPQAVE